MDSEVSLPSGRRLSTLKVKELQKELHRRQLSCAGRKADLLARLTEYIITYESGQHSTGDQVNVSPVTIEEQPSCEVFFTPREVTEEKPTKKKGHKRRSHSRLNETFEYVEEDDEDTTQVNSTLTPEGRGTAPLVDASHRKSSRQAKDRRSRGDSAVNCAHEAVRAQTPRSSRKSRRSSAADKSGVTCSHEAVRAQTPRSSRKSRRSSAADKSGVTYPHEAVRAQTPRSSMKSRRSSAADKSGFLTDDEIKHKPEDMPAPSDFLTDDECDEHHASQVNPGHTETMEFAPIVKDIQQIGDISKSPNTLSSSRHHFVRTPKEVRTPEVNTPTPRSGSRSRGGFAAPTISSVARSASRKEPLFPTNETVAKAIVKTNASTPQPSNSVKSKRVTGSKSKKDVLQGLPSASRSIKKKEKGNATAHFARQHARLFAEMESISDQHERIARKHEETMRAVPNVVKRLATPKSVRKPLRDANAGTSTTKKAEYVFDVSKAKTTVTEKSFNFGKVEDFRPEQNQGSSGTVTTSFSLRASKTRDERDVKSRTKTASKQRTAKSFLALTMPVDNPKLNLLATPKGMAPAQSRQKVVYTPRRGALGAFVDTTKLSDREFELAVANGLIKGRSRTSSRAEISRKSRRDDILDVKRKLNI